MTPKPFQVLFNQVSTLERLLGWVLKGSALLSGFILLGVTLLVSYTVFCRYVLNQPILGDKELVEMGITFTVMLAMPYVAFQKAHIRVDILDQIIGVFGRFFGDLFARSATCFVLYLLARKAWQKTLDAHEFNDVTNMIELPTALIYGAITIGMSFFILVLITQILSQLRKGITEYE